MDSGRGRFQWWTGPKWLKLQQGSGPAQRRLRIGFDAPERLSGHSFDLEGNPTAYGFSAEVARPRFFLSGREVEGTSKVTRSGTNFGTAMWAASKSGGGPLVVPVETRRNARGDSNQGEDPRTDRLWLSESGEQFGGASLDGDEPGDGSWSDLEAVPPGLTNFCLCPRCAHSEHAAIPTVEVNRRE